MGYSRDLFTNQEIDEEFICLICYDVLKEMKLLKPCEHAFCSSCIQEMRITAKSNACPYCRRDIVDTMKPPRMILNLLNKLELKCPFTANGCGTVLKLGALPDHDQKCKFNPENQKECEGRCGAVVTQFERKSGAHNCVDYLTEQWQVTKDELRATNEHWQLTKDELEATKKQLQDSEEKLKQTLEDGDGKSAAPQDEIPLPSFIGALDLALDFALDFVDLYSKPYVPPYVPPLPSMTSSMTLGGRQASRARQRQWGKNRKGGDRGRGRVAEGRPVPKERYFKKEKKWNGR